MLNISDLDKNTVQMIARILDLFMSLSRTQQADVAANCFSVDRKNMFSPTYIVALDKTNERRKRIERKSF